MDANILLVDDNPAMIHLMGRILAGHARLRFSTSGTAALAQLRQAPVDLVLLDAEMPGMSGTEVLSTIKSDPQLADTPVVFVTGRTDPEFEVKGLELGAVDFITKPISEPLLLARVMTQLRVKRLTDELRRVASTDALTGVLNRRSFDSVLHEEWERAQRHRTPISLLMMDVDHFKRFNDHYGHPAGDACLQAVGLALGAAVLRPADKVARYGGEEFALLLPQTSRQGAGHLAERVLQSVAAMAIPHEASPVAPQLTVSIGVASFDEASPAWDEDRDDARPGGLPRRDVAALLKAADKALYAAKAAGRNRSVMHDIDGPPCHAG